MTHRWFVFMSVTMGLALPVGLLSSAACGGAGEPGESDSGATQFGAGENSSVAQPGATDSPADSSAPGATPTPLPAALPSEVLANPVTKDVYPEAVPGGILRRGGYFDPAHYDLMQVSSVSNSFKQMMVLNNLLRYNPIDAGKTIIPDLATTWEVSEDGKVWTFPLREGVHFHDSTMEPS